MKAWEFKVANDPITGAPRKPWEHQLADFAAFKDADAFGCWSEMGTGKTSTAINILEYKRSRCGLNRGLILVPASIVDGWEEEFLGAWGIRPLNLTRMRSSAQRLRAIAACPTGTPYLLSNYDGLMGIEDALYDWLGKDFSMVADESTYFKNGRAQRSKAVLRLGNHASFKMAMSGTPGPQGEEDYFSQYLYLDPRIFGTSFVGFRNYWMTMGGFMGREVMGLRPELRKEFNKRLYSVASRHVKAECMDMPPKNYVTLRYDLEPSEQRVYDQLAAEWIAEVTEGGKRVSVTDGMTRSLRMAQVCTGFIGDRQAGETEEHEIPRSGSKLAVLQELLENLDGKAIIWCKWKRNVRDVLALCKKLKIKAVSFYGETDDKKASDFAFRNDPKTRVTVGTQKSGGAGRNLQGPEVKTVVYFSQDYSNEARMQSEDRAHRGGISHTVTIYDIVARHTIEEAIVKTLRDGRNAMDFILQNPKEFAVGKVPGRRK